MSDRTVVVVSLLWVGLLLVLSRQWLGDVRQFVIGATHLPQSDVRPPSAIDIPGGYRVPEFVQISPGVLAGNPEYQDRPGHYPYRPSP